MERRWSIRTSADFGPRLGFAYAATPRIVVRGGYGISYVHYTRAGSGDILAINAPNALFVSVPQPKPGTAGYRTVDQGFPQGLATTFNPATDNITYIPKNTRDSYVQDFFVSVQNQLAKNSLLDIAFVGNHGVKLQGFLNANQINPAAGFTRPYTRWPSDITAAVNEFWSQYQALQVRYEQRSVAGLTLLNSFTWSHSLDNASASLEGNTPSPQDGNNIAADYAQSDYNLPIANITSLVYDLAVWTRKAVSWSKQWPGERRRGWMAAQRDQHHAGWHSVQPYLHAELRECALAADLGYVSRSERVSSEPRERGSSDGEGQAVQWVYPVCQLLRARLAGYQERQR